jgi:hypothetical protein
MKRIIISLITLLLVGLASIWTLVFTATGNRMIHPWVERYAQSYLPQATLEQLSISPSQVQVTLSLQQSQRIEFNALTDWWQVSASGQWRLYSTDLSLLNALLPIRLAGALSSEGRFEYASDKLMLDAKLQLPHSLINFHAEQTPGKNTIQAQLWGDLALMDGWTLLEQPKLASGTLNLTASAEIPRQQPLNLSGQATLNLPDGKLYHHAFNELTAQQLPQDLAFKLTSHTELVSGNSLSKLQLNSELANVQLTDTRYQLGGNQISTQHEISINDLTQLHFITQVPLHGAIQLRGDTQYQLSSKSLTVTAQSDTLGGRINTQLINKDFTAQLQDLSAVDVSRLLGMKPVFQSRLDGKINYRLDQQNGDFSVLLSDGRILPNDVSALLNQAARFDITREIYNTVTTSGQIQHKVITADLDMQSRLTQISSQAARIDLAQQALDVLLKFESQGVQLPVRLKGDLTNPEVSADFSGLLQHRLKENLKQNTEKAAQEAIEKEKEKLQQQFKLPKLFNP